MYTYILDKSFRMSTRTTRERLNEFCRFVMYLYGPHYLRHPTSSDIQQLFTHHLNVHVFLGMLESLYYMHWRWNMCPNAYHGQSIKGKYYYSTVLLERRWTKYKFGYYLVNEVYPEKERKDIEWVFWAPKRRSQILCHNINISWSRNHDRGDVYVYHIT